MATASDYRMRLSDPVPTDSLSRMWEGWAIRDVNGDGLEDLVLANGGEASTPVQPSDSPITIMLGQPDYTFKLADTSELPPPGWINDFVFLDSNNNGIAEIIAIDHGVEIATSLDPSVFDPTAGDPEEYWEPLGIYEFDTNSNKFVDRTDEAIGNKPNFYHSASNTADINKDGIKDLIVTSLDSDGSFNIFTGDSNNVIVESSESLLRSRLNELTADTSRDFVVAGTAAFLDYGADGDYDPITLPYDYNPEHPRSEDGVIFEFDDGEFIADHSFNVRTGPDFEIDSSWGYSHTQTQDINGDGLQDIVALAEDPNTLPNGNAVFITMIQKKNGSFLVSKAFPDEPIITNREGALHPETGYQWTDKKFRLADLDSDGDLDLYWGELSAQDSSTLETGLYFNDGGGRFYKDDQKAHFLTEQIQWPGESDTKTLMQDLNGDGIGDFVSITTTYGEDSAHTVRSYLSESSIAANPSEIRFNGLRDRFNIEHWEGEIHISDKLGNYSSKTLPDSGRAHFQDISVAFDTDDTTEPDNPTDDPQARVFLAADGDFTIADAAVVFGRSGGDEAVELTPGALGVRLDGNVETVTLPQPLSSTTFQVRDGRLEVRDDSEPLITFTSGLNEAVTLQFNDGEGTLTQTGAERFSLAGPGGEASIGDSPVTPEIGLGGAVKVDGSDDGRTFDAASGDTTLEFADGDYDVTVDSFAEGDELDFADVAGSNEAILNILADSDLSDGQKTLSATDPADGQAVTVTLTGLTTGQDVAVFNAGSFANAFGSDALVV